MIPHRLNLLSPDKRKNLKRMVNFQFTKSLLNLTLIILSCIGIVFLGGQWILQNYFNEVTAQITSVTNKYAEKNQEIKAINMILTQTDRIQTEQQLMTGRILEITNQIPDGIILNSLKIDQDRINLSGSAYTREDLLQLAKKLETIDWLSEINIPPEQLTQKDNIIFAISPTIK